MTDSHHLYTSKGALARKLTPYLNNSDLADMSIKYGQRQFVAHRLVVGAWSEKFAKMIDESTESIITLNPNATDKETQVFENVLRFLYTGEVNFTSDTVRMMMNLSEQLDLKQLGEMAQEWVGEMIDRGSMVSAITWLREAMEYNRLPLRDSCLRILALYFEYIPEASWLGLNTEEVVSIIEQDDVVADDEEAIIKRIDAWLAAKNSTDETQHTYREMASRIRFPFLEASKLAAMQEKSPIVKFAATHCPHLLSEAYKFRALCAELSKSNDEDDSRTVQLDSSVGACMLRSITAKPRLYLNFLPTGGQRSYRPSSSSQKERWFREMNIGSTNYMECLVQKLNRPWKMSDHYYCWKLDMQLTTKAMGDVDVWSLKYEIKPDDQRMRSGQSAPEQQYKVVIVTRPLDKDSDFYLPDNPVVITCHGSIKRSPGSHYSPPPITSSTPPIFAGKKPKKVEVAAIAYITMNQSDLQRHVQRRDRYVL